MAGWNRYSRILIVSLAAVGVTGCTEMGTTAPPLITLTVKDGARWITPGDLHRYQCQQGWLLCTAETGRLTRRLCQCVDRPRE